MRLRVAQVNCVIDEHGRAPEDLLRAWATLPAIASAAAKAGAEVTVFQASRRAVHHREDGISYRFVPEPRLRGGSGRGIMPWRMAAAVQRAAPDVIHLNGLDFRFHARALGMLGIPVLAQDHASRTLGRAAYLRRWGYSKAAAVAFTSSAQADPFISAGQLCTDIPVFAIPESSSDFAPGDRDEARQASGVFGDPALLWVGHLDENKDPLTILEAVRRALQRLPELQLWCAFGSGQLLPQVQRLVRSDRQLAAHVHLLGRVPHEQVETLCRACDFFVLGSHREGSGYALLEALACGLPPIVSDIPSFRALTGEGAVGALVPPGESDALASALVRLAERPRENLRAAVRDHFQRHLSFEAVGARLVEAYASLAAQRVR